MNSSFICIFRCKLTFGAEQKHYWADTHTNTHCKHTQRHRPDCNKTLLLSLAPAETPASPSQSSLFSFHPSFVTVCQRIKKRLRALKGLIHLPLFCLFPLRRLLSICLSLLLPPTHFAHFFSLVLFVFCTFHVRDKNRLVVVVKCKFPTDPAF